MDVERYPVTRPGFRAVVGALVLSVVACASPSGDGGAPGTSAGVTGGEPTAGPAAIATSRPRAPDPTATITPGATHRATTSPAEATPSPAPSATVSTEPTPSATPSLDPPPRPGAFEMDLYAKGDFVSQATRDWCTAAAMQIMLNIAGDGPADRTRASQEQLFELGRSNLPVRRGRGIPPPPWAAALEQAGLGPYVVHAESTRPKAIQAAARAMRLTGRPVGLVTWRGAHSWVMSGFRATADPAYTDVYKVTAIWTEDPWYPLVSSIWGRSNPPHTLVSLQKLGEDFLPWVRPNGRYPEYKGQYLVVLPVVEAPAS